MTPRLSVNVNKVATLRNSRGGSVPSVLQAVDVCLASARGCTVIPAAPAFSTTRTASITLGIWPPRELRSVATLLTLTESWTIRYALMIADW